MVPDFLHGLAQESSTGCWLWRLRLNKAGYGKKQFATGKRSWLAHRWVYEKIVGPIAEGLEVDHLCRVRHCVNPKHLEPVPPLVNRERAVPYGFHSRSQTHCKHGHEFDSENTYYCATTNQRVCRKCNAAAARRRSAR